MCRLLVLGILEIETDVYLPSCFSTMLNQPLRSSVGCTATAQRMPEGQRVGEGSESIEASGSLLCRKISSVVAEASHKNSLLAPPALMLQDSLFVDVCMRDEDIRISTICGREHMSWSPWRTVASAHRSDNSDALAQTGCMARARGIKNA